MDYDLIRVKVRRPVAQLVWSQLQVNICIQTKTKQAQGTQLIRASPGSCEHADWDQRAAVCWISTRKSSPYPSRLNSKRGRDGGAASIQGGGPVFAETKPVSRLRSLQGGVVIFAEVVPLSTDCVRDDCLTGLSKVTLARMGFATSMTAP